MSKERVKELLAQLRKEIRDTDIDDELGKIMSELDDDIQSAVDKADAAVDEAVNLDEVVDRAKEIEASFATSHPTAERVIREVIDLLVRMGI